MTQSPATRFRPWSDLDALRNRDGAFRLPVPGDPVVELFADQLGRIGIRIRTDSTVALPPVALAAMSLARVQIDGHAVVELSTDQAHLFRDFYGFACGIADRVQLNGEAPEAAVVNAIEAGGELLAETILMSQEKKTGLFGELTVMRKMADEFGWRASLESWIGPDQEQHDFSVGAIDLEVKTTLSESRKHMIHGLGQLRPTPGRPLFLVSVQLTRVGDGGQSLASLVQEVEAACIGDAGSRALLDAKLAAYGWSQAVIPFAQQALVPRSDFRLVPSGDLPALTTDVLNLDSSEMSRVSEVSYRLDVDGLGVEQPDLGAWLRAQQGESG